MRPKRTTTQRGGGAAAARTTLTAASESLSLRALPPPPRRCSSRAAFEIANARLRANSVAPRSTITATTTKIFATNERNKQQLAMEETPKNLATAAEEENALLFKKWERQQEQDLFPQLFPILKCDQCDKQFYTHFKLKRHYQIHEEISPRQCRHCPKRFNRLDYLREHEQGHQRVGSLRKNVLLKIKEEIIDHANNDNNIPRSKAENVNGRQCSDKASTSSAAPHYFSTFMESGDDEEEDDSSISLKLEEEEFSEMDSFCHPSPSSSFLSSSLLHFNKRRQRQKHSRSGPARKKRIIVSPCSSSSPFPTTPLFGGESAVKTTKIPLTEMDYIVMQKCDVLNRRVEVAIDKHEFQRTLDTLKEKEEQMRKEKKKNKKKPSGQQQFLNGKEVHQLEEEKDCDDIIEIPLPSVNSTQEQMNGDVNSETNTSTTISTINNGKKVTTNGGGNENNNDLFSLCECKADFERIAAKLGLQLREECGSLVFLSLNGPPALAGSFICFSESHKRLNLICVDEFHELHLTQTLEWERTGRRQFLDTVLGRCVQFFSK